jgi:hypothetical protein
MRRRITQVKQNAKYKALKQAETQQKQRNDAAHSDFSVFI